MKFNMRQGALGAAVLTLVLFIVTAIGEGSVAEAVRLALLPCLVGGSIGLGLLYFVKRSAERRD